MIIVFKLNVYLPHRKRFYQMSPAAVKYFGKFKFGEAIIQTLIRQNHLVYFAFTLKQEGVVLDVVN
jgi:hypothetical protein